MKLSLLFGWVVALVHPVASQLIKLPNGATITGTLETNVANQSVQVFRGIPYAEAPIGNRRWKQAVLKPVATNVNATAFGRICPGDARYDWQSAAFESSEDCLFLNVYAPAGVSAKAKLPVLIYIHGGSFVAGAGNIFDGGNLIAAANSQLVFVSINYHLSVFGFLSNDALKGEGEGVNYGLRDQETAFTWIRQCIKYFGGNPKDITAMGESAGAKSVFTHLIARKGKQKLFQKAIAESGALPSVHDIPTSDQQNSVTALIASKVGCNDTSNASVTLQCLRSADTSAIWSAGGLLSWQPVVDGVYLLRSPSLCVQAGAFSKVPTIFGTNTDEGWLFITQFVNAPESVMPYVRSRFSRLTVSELEQVDTLYPPTSFVSPKHRASEIYGDAIYACPTEVASREFAGRGLTTFRYRFNQTSTRLGWPLAVHTAELNYVFNNASILPQDPVTQTFVKSLQRYWISFSSRGSPNNGQEQIWPQYDVASNQQIVLQASNLALETPGSYMPQHKERCEFWNAVELRLASALS